MGNGLAARNGGRVGLAALLAILLLGAGLRVDQAWDGRAPVYDAAAYAAIAANLERGEGFTAGPAATQPSSNYSPGRPLRVAGAYDLTGGVHERAARVLLALIGSLTVLFTYLIGRRLGRGVPEAGSDRLQAHTRGAAGAWGGGDLPGAPRVPGDADERAAGGDPVVGRGARDVLGSGLRPRCSGEVVAPGLAAWNARDGASRVSGSRLAAWGCRVRDRAPERLAAGPHPGGPPARGRDRDCRPLDDSQRRRA